ncbi:MAG: tRNA pseudouridine(13) synthase TruD [Bacteroidales bacterium]
MNYTNSELPYISNKSEGTGGKIKTCEEDFIVNEIPAYEPSGEGEHLFIHITKRGITTKDVQKALAKIYNANFKDVEFAGIKDKHALTSQYFSVWLRNGQSKNLAYELEKNMPITINNMEFHNRKLKMGHLRGNAFKIKIREIKMSLDEAYTRACKIAEEIHKKGLPNFYGEQRFGKDGDNAERGFRLLKGQEIVHNKWLKRFLLSSLQSNLFNYYLTKRIENKLFDKILKGDIAKKQDTGGLFVVEEVDDEQKRLENKEICFTGPMFGKKMKQAGDKAGELEASVLQENDITEEEIKKAKLTGTRRAGIIIPEIKIEQQEDGLNLEFSLPKGAFATIVLREIMKNEVNTD